MIEVKRELGLGALAIAVLCTGVAAQQKRTLPAIDVAGLQKAIAGQKGKVVFVNFWATWCGPCVAEFPEIVKLYQKYHAKGLEVIAVSFDEDAPTAMPFLDKQNATFINFLRDPKQEDSEFILGFDKEAGEAAALPLTWVFDRAGKRQYLKLGRFSPAELDRLIPDLLSQK